jgi:hypothetical protein
MSGRCPHRVPPHPPSSPRPSRTAWLDANGSSPGASGSAMKAMGRRGRASAGDTKRSRERGVPSAAARVFGRAARPPQARAHTVVTDPFAAPRKKKKKNMPPLALLRRAGASPAVSRSRPAPASRRAGALTVKAGAYFFVLRRAGVSCVFLCDEGWSASATRRGAAGPRLPLFFSAVSRDVSLAMPRQCAVLRRAIDFTQKRSHTHTQTQNHPSPRMRPRRRPRLLRPRRPPARHPARTWKRRCG